MALNAKDVLSGSQGVAYVTVNGNRYQLANLKNINARAAKTKTEVPILGRTGKGNKATGWSGTGSMTMYFNTPIFRTLMIDYIKTGRDFYFDLQVTNDDSSSDAGRQTMILRNCNLDSVLMVNLDADSDALEEDMDFTFDDIDNPEVFNILPELL